MNVRKKLKFLALPVPEIIGVSEKLGSPWIRPRPLVSKIFNGLLLGLSLRMFGPNLKFIALSVPEIIGGAPNKLGSPWIRPRPLSPKFLRRFARIEPANVPAKFEIHSFERF